MSRHGQDDDNLSEKRDFYVEGCPGCKVDQKKSLQKGLPFKQVFIVWMIVLSTGLTISSLFPFLYFMIRDFHIAKREEDIGFYAGFVGSSYMIGRALTSVLWGVIADKYGRKPVIIIGCATIVIFNTLFGLGVNYWMAITTRFLLGIMNGLLGPIKAYACETVREEHQSIGLSAVSTAWGTGLVFGPALGGFLAQPADKYPSIFSTNSLFGRFPYFLPCLITSIFSAIVMVACFWIPVLSSKIQEMQETLHSHKSDKMSSDHILSDAMESATQGSDTTRNVEAKTSILTNWPLMSSIIVYCVFSLQDMAYTEIFSLWAESPRRLGGLSYTTGDVGTVLVISGTYNSYFCHNILVPCIAYSNRHLQLSAASNIRLGPSIISIFIISSHREDHGSSRTLGIVSIPLLTSYHYIAMLSGITLSIVLNCACLVKNVFSISIITGMFILQNRAVDQDQRGAANGMAMMLMSLFKAAGPAGGGALFSWSQKRLHAHFLPGDHMVFFILNMVMAIGVLMTFKPFLVERHKD